MLEARWLAVWGLLAMALGCGEDRPFGSPCEGDSDCESSLCVAGVDGDEPKCAQTCGGDDECPEGFSCSAVTGGNVVVCRRGSGTPFGR